MCLNICIKQAQLCLRLVSFLLWIALFSFVLDLVQAWFRMCRRGLTRIQIVSTGYSQSRGKTGSRHSQYSQNQVPKKSKLNQKQFKQSSVQTMPIQGPEGLCRLGPDTIKTSSILSLLGSNRIETQSRLIPHRVLTVRTRSRQDPDTDQTVSKSLKKGLDRVQRLSRQGP